MAFNKLTEDLNIHQSLAKEPNDVGGLDYRQLQAKFDEAANIIKDYINNVLIPALEDNGATSMGVEPFTGITATNVQSALEQLQQNINDVQAGTVTDGSITAAKLANLAVNTAKLAELAVATSKIADLAVATSKIADLAVTTGKIANSAVTTDKINNGAVTADKIAATAVTLAKLSADVLTYFRKVSDKIPFTDITGNIPSNRVDTNDGNLNPLVLRYGVHFFNSVAEYNSSGYASTSALCFVKK